MRSIFEFRHQLILVLFIIEALLKIIAVAPRFRLYFGNGCKAYPSAAGFQLFHIHDPEHWGTLGLSLLTLFRVVTLENWTDVMYMAMEAHPFAS
ncbi:MAG: ion transporter [Candidatus Thiodiazotropha sp. (ex. Lucinoma kazani)]